MVNLSKKTQSFQFPNLPYLEILTRCMTSHGRTGPYEYISGLVRDYCLLLAPVGHGLDVKSGVTVTGSGAILSFFGIIRWESSVSLISYPYHHHHSSTVEE